MNTDIVIGGNVRRLRLERGMTQEELANRIGLARSSISNIEVGKQQLLIQVLERIAEALDVPPGQLLPATWWPHLDIAQQQRLGEKLIDVRLMLREILEEL